MTTSQPPIRWWPGVLVAGACAIAVSAVWMMPGERSTEENRLCKNCGQLSVGSRQLPVASRQSPVASSPLLDFASRALEPVPLGATGEQWQDRDGGHRGKTGDRQLATSNWRLYTSVADLAPKIHCYIRHCSKTAEPVRWSQGNLASSRVLLQASAVHWRLETGD
jgi:hypothetical protein